MNRRSIIATLLLSLAAAVPAEAQRRDELTGKLVRVTAPNFADHVVTGTVTTYTEEGIAVTEQGTGAEHHFPLRSVQRIDIFRGTGAAAAAPRRARSYGFVGFALGVLAGPVLAIVTDHDFATTTALSAAGGLAGGLALGALSGTAHPTEQWTWNVRPWGYDPNLRPAQPPPEVSP
jgi:hypothetical protein